MHPFRCDATILAPAGATYAGTTRLSEKIGNRRGN
ncbi:hypothetical protein SHL15_7452 [Streptomyces hygroscopicus subsp. limoneus]|nr:hypothetical protein SHL15_7452 [Streptomyces hygroscopicus subsp. limoneus]